MISGISEMSRSDDPCVARDAETELAVGPSFADMALRHPQPDSKGDA